MRENYFIKRELVIQYLILELVENDIENVKSIRDNDALESAYNRSLLRLEYGKKALNSETYRAALDEKENQIRSLIDPSTSCESIDDDGQFRHNSSVHFLNKDFPRRVYQTPRGGASHHHVTYPSEKGRDDVCHIKQGVPQ